MSRGSPRVDDDRGSPEAFGRDCHQLEKRLQAVHCAKRVGRGDDRARRADFEMIGLVFAKPLDWIARAGGFYHQRNLAAGHIIVIGNSGLVRERIDETHTRKVEACVLVAPEPNSEGAIDLEGSFSLRDVQRYGHQRKRAGCLSAKGRRVLENKT